MNEILKRLKETGDIKQLRTLVYSIDDDEVAYVNEYKMNTILGPFTWYCTWRAPEQHDAMKLCRASIRIHDARARVYFPAFLDSRIPPANREPCQLIELLEKYGMKEYDKFDFIIATKGKSPIKLGLVKEIENVECPYDEIHEIEEIWKEYNRDLGGN